MNCVFTVQNNAQGMSQPHFCFHVYMGRFNLTRTHTPHTPPQHAKYSLCMGKEGLQMNITFPAGPDLANLSLAGRGTMVWSINKQKGVAWQPEQREEDLSRPLSLSLMHWDAAWEQRVQVSSSTGAQSRAAAREPLRNRAHLARKKHQRCKTKRRKCYKPISDGILFFIC